MMTFDEAVQHVVCISDLPVDEQVARQHQFDGDLRQNQLLTTMAAAAVNYLTVAMASGSMNIDEALVTAFMNGVLLGTTVGVYMERQEIPA